MNLAELLTSAATDADAPLTLDLAAVLYAAVVEDRQAFGLHIGPPAARMTVTLHPTAEGPVTAAVQGVLRYTLDRPGDIMRLCTVPECENESSGSGLLTRVCVDHLDLAVSGMLPNAADDITPGMREQAAIDSRSMRLSAWESEARETLRVAEGDLRVIAAKRAQVNA